MNNGGNMNYIKDSKFYFLNKNLDDKRTGIENSTLLRARLFEKYLHVSPIIVTTQYNPRLNLQRKELVKLGLISKNIKIINLYEYFQETITDEVILKDDHWKINSEWKYQRVEGTSDYRIFDESGKKIIYRKCDKEGRLEYNNIFLNNKIIRRDYYDSNNYLSKIQQVDPETGEVFAETYYRIDRSPCIHKHFKIINGKRVLSLIQLLSREGTILHSFETEEDFISYWIKTLVEDNCRIYFIMERPEMFYHGLKNIKQPNIIKIAMIHSSHLQWYKEKKSYLTCSLNTNYSMILNDFSEFDHAIDAVIVLTETQKEHIKERFGDYNKLYAIPHAIENDIQPVGISKREPQKAIYVSRYSAVKQHDNLVRIFKMVVEAHPNATLHFYGYGPEKNKIIQLVQELGLEKNIKINDFIENVEDVYNSASLSINTSLSEGFSLFILESIAHGLPVISYDIDYGPNEMIDHGVNGYLVDLNNEGKMAEYIIDLFRNQKKLEVMSEASYKKSKEFTAERVMEKWRIVLSEISSKKEKK